MDVVYRVRKTWLPGNLLIACLQVSALCTSLFTYSPSTTAVLNMAIVMISISHGFSLLNTWSPVSGADWGGLGGVTLLEEVCHWAGFGVSKPHAFSKGLSLSLSPLRYVLVVHDASCSYNMSSVCPHGRVGAENQTQVHCKRVFSKLNIKENTAIGTHH